MVEILFTNMPLGRAVPFGKWEFVVEGGCEKSLGGGDVWDDAGRGL